MTDRVNTLTVVLEHEMRDDDARIVMDAIKMLRHVADVRLGSTEDRLDVVIAKRQLRLELYQKMVAILDD